MTRYADVIAALRDPKLWPAIAAGEDQSETRDETGRLREAREAQRALSPNRLAEWDPAMVRLAREASARLCADRPIDLLAEFAKPWGLEVAMLVLQCDQEGRPSLSELGDLVFAGMGTPDDSPAKVAAAKATAELERILKNGIIPMGEPTFVALSQTLPRLMASGWLALVSEPGEWMRLHTQPERIPAAVDEMLRHSGIVRRIWRRAMEATEIGGAAIARDDRVMLMLASANRDPLQFHTPELFDPNRSEGAHLAMGAGRNSCAGAALVRAAFIVPTGALVGRFASAELVESPPWKLGGGYCVPETLMVRLSSAVA